MLLSQIRKLALKEKLGYKNIMEVPKLQKTVLSVGLNTSVERDAFTEAQKQIGNLREKLARKQLDIAQMYERIRSYQAAAFSYESLFDDYYDSTLADDALVGAMRNYLAFGINCFPVVPGERICPV